MNRGPKQHLLLPERNFGERCCYAFYKDCCDIVHQYQMCDQSGRRGYLAQQSYCFRSELPVSGVEERIVHATTQCNPAFSRCAEQAVTRMLAAASILSETAILNSYITDDGMLTWG